MNKEEKINLDLKILIQFIDVDQQLWDLGFKCAISNQSSPALYILLGLSKYKTVFSDFANVLQQQQH